MNLIRVNLKSRIAHFGTTNTNHTTNMTYTIPPRTSLLGMFGAVMGLNFHTVINEYSKRIDFGWEWLSKNTSKVIMKQRMKIERKINFDEIIKKNGRGSYLEQFCKGDYYTHTLDSIEYIVPKKERLLDANWYIQVDNELINDVLEKLNSQVYQIQMGTSECIASIQNVEILNANRLYGEFESNMIVSNDIVKNAICEKMPRFTKGHRQGYLFESYWTNGLNKMKGESEYGIWKLEDRNIAVM